MATSKSVEFLSGRLFWAKVTGAPVPNYGGDAREWTFEFEPDEAGIAILRKHKLLDRLKEKEDAKNPDKGRYIVLRKKEFSANGDANAPIRLYNKEDAVWDGGLIGNGSKADVKIDIRDYGVGKKKGVYPVAIRVTDPIEYQSSEFGGMDKIEAEAAAAPAKKPRKAPEFAVDLDDDIPF